MLTRVLLNSVTNTISLHNVTKLTGNTNQLTINNLPQTWAVIFLSCLSHIYRTDKIWWIIIWQTTAITKIMQAINNLLQIPESPPSPLKVIQNIIFNPAKVIKVKVQFTPINSVQSTTASKKQVCTSLKMICPRLCWPLLISVWPHWPVGLTSSMGFLLVFVL